MPTLRINGTQLEYIERGRGQPVIFVHGTLGDYRSWGLQMNTFAENYRSISYSRRYHYPNPCRGDENDYSAILHADDLAQFITGLGFESAYIVGNSYGAYTALFLAVRYPERVRAMVVGEPPVFPLLEHISEGRDLKNDFLENIWKPTGELLQQDKMKDGVRRFVDGVVNDGAFDQFPPKIQKLIMDNACELKIETSSSNFWTPLTGNEAKQIETPTLLLTGENSLKMFQLVVAELERCLPNNKYVIVPHCTHELPADNSKVYNEIVMEFLAEQST